MSVVQSFLVLIGMTIMVRSVGVASHDYANALSKKLIVFEGQRSGFTKNNMEKGLCPS